MSLSIDSRLVSGVYAFGQWFECTVGSVYVDAYEFVQYEESFPVGYDDSDRCATVYMMADAYPDLPNDGGVGDFGEHSKKTFASPRASCGIQFLEEGTGDVVSFPLLEVKAFRTRPPREYTGKVL